MEITRKLAIRVRDVVDAGLVYGVGTPVPGQMCVEAAVCYAMGLPHSDAPTCVAPGVRWLKVRLNDVEWSSPATRARGLRRLAVAQLGSAGVLDERVFRARVVEMTIRRAVPVGLRAAASRVPAHAQALEAAALRCEREGGPEALDAATAATTAAYNYAITAVAYAVAADASAYASGYAAAASATSAVAYAALAAASDDADDAVEAAVCAAAHAAEAAAAVIAINAAAYSSAANATTHTTAQAARDGVLAQYAEWVVQILLEMGAPGCQWLDVVPLDLVDRGR